MNSGNLFHLRFTITCRLSESISVTSFYVLAGPFPLVVVYIDERIFCFCYDVFWNDKR